MIVRRVGRVKARIGGALHTIDRNSFGELCFPLGVATVFSLAGDDYLKYLVPMLVLTFGDSLAALVGIYRGRWRFRTLDGYKTVEGSFALFAVSLICIVLPYGIAGALDLAPLLLIGISVALLIALVEALTWRGMDNFLLPVVAFYLLDAHLSLNAGSLMLLALSGSTMALAFLIWRRFRLAKE